MLTINIDKKEVLEDIPRVKEWIDIFKNKFNKKIKKNNTSFYYTYHYIIPDPEQSDDDFDDMVSECINMLYEDRLEYEISKVDINITMKVDDMLISDKINKDNDGVPKVINEVISEITKVKMILESEFNDNEEVKKSIPEIDDEIVKIETEYEGEYSDEINLDFGDEIDNVNDFDVDEILDKISKTGMGGLTKAEKKFLNDKSKNI